MKDTDKMTRASLLMIFISFSLVSGWSLPRQQPPSKLRRPPLPPIGPQIYPMNLLPGTPGPKDPFLTTIPPPHFPSSTTVPPPPPNAEENTKIIESFHVKSDIRFRFATTQILSVVRNVADRAQEIAFDVTLPKDAFIVQFSMEIDGKVTKGEVKEKTEAKKEYQAAVDRGQSAGHVRQAPRHANIFEVSVNVASTSAVKFNLTYQEILQRKFGSYEQEIHVNPGQAVEDFSIEIYVQENKPIKFVRTPTLRNDSLITNRIEEENDLTFVDRPSDKTAYITYRPSLDDQGDKGVSARFVLQYDVEHGTKGEVMVVDGYFIHFFAPELPPMPKDIIFVLDVSGSMYGRKIDQLQEAMRTILKDLKPEDRFNIITFSSHVLKWKPGLVDAQGDVMREARDFVKQMKADGMTNINDALLTAIKELKGREDSARVPMIFFLTDGVPTAGITSTDGISANVADSNGEYATIFGLAFGSGADFEMLKTMSAQNSGFARRIYEASDAALQVASLYQEISAVAMKDISIDYLPSSVDEFSITDNEFPVIFNGSEVIICGRMAHDAEVFELEISGLQKSGPVELELEIDNIDNIVIDTEDSVNPFFTVPRDFAGIVEKMWAYITIKQLLREKERHSSDETKVKELKEKILSMSLQYQFVTPLTSMVVTQLDESDRPIESGLEDAFDHSSFPDAMTAYHNTQGAGAPSMVMSAHVPQRQYYYDPPMVLAGLQPSRAGRKSMGNPGPRPTMYVPRMLNRQTATHVPSTTMGASIGGAPLASVTARSDNLSLCLTSRNMVDGTYNLITFPDGTTINIETSCADSACRQALIKQIVVASGGEHVTISTDPSIRGWVYSSSSSLFTVNVHDRKTLSMQMGDVEMRVERLRRRKSGEQYAIELKFGSAKGYSGIIGDILNMPERKLQRWSRKRVPGICRRQRTDISKCLNRKYAVRYWV